MKKALRSLFYVTALTLLAACSFSTANYSDLKMASEIDADNKPVTLADTFKVDSPIIYVTGKVKNAPDGTEIKSEWVYTESDPPTDIDSAVYEVTDTTSNFHFSLSKPDNGWPVGSYEVKLYINDKEKETIAFKVE